MPQSVVVSRGLYSTFVLEQGVVELFWGVGSPRDQHMGTSMVLGCAGPGVAVLVAVHLPYAGMDFPTYHICTFFCFVLTWHPAIPPYDSGMFYNVLDYFRQRPDYSHYSAMDYLTLCQLCSLTQHYSLLSQHPLDITCSLPICLLIILPSSI